MEALMMRPGAVARHVGAIATGMLLTLLPVAAEARNVQLMAPGGGQVRALVIGINDYTARSIPTLKGAVADALDLEKTLRAAGVSDLVALIDQRDPTIRPLP